MQQTRSVAECCSILIDLQSILIIHCTQCLAVTRTLWQDWNLKGKRATLQSQTREGGHSREGGSGEAGMCRGRGGCQEISQSGRQVNDSSRPERLSKHPDKQDSQFKWPCAVAMNCFYRGRGHERGRSAVCSHPSGHFPHNGCQQI